MYTLCVREAKDEDIENPYVPRICYFSVPIEKTREDFFSLLLFLETPLNRSAFGNIFQTIFKECDFRAA